MAWQKEWQLAVLCEECGHLTPITDHDAHLRHLRDTHGRRVNLPPTDEPT